MHDDVLSQAELAQIIPAEHAAGLHHMTEIHHDLVALGHFVIHIVGHQHVDRLAGLTLRAQRGQNRVDGLRVDPIVRIHHLDIHACRRRDTGVHRAAVTLVLLMNRPHDAWIGAFQLTRVLQRAVFRTVVHNQHFEVAGVARRKQRVHATVEIGLHIVCGDYKGERLCRVGHESLTSSHI